MNRFPPQTSSDANLAVSVHLKQGSTNGLNSHFFLAMAADHPSLES